MAKTERASEPGGEPLPNWREAPRTNVWTVVSVSHDGHGLPRPVTGS